MLNDWSLVVASMDETAMGAKAHFGGMASCRAVVVVAPGRRRDTARSQSTNVNTLKQLVFSLMSDFQAALGLLYSICEPFNEMQISQTIGRFVHVQ